MLVVLACCNLLVLQVGGVIIWKTILMLLIILFAAELFVNGEIVQRPPERQRRVEPVPQRSSDRPRYNDRTRYARRRENQQR
jgi:hypothetical protein